MDTTTPQKAPSGNLKREPVHKFPLCPSLEEGVGVRCHEPQILSCWVLLGPQLSQFLSCWVPLGPQLSQFLFYRVPLSPHPSQSPTQILT